MFEVHQLTQFITMMNILRLRKTNLKAKQLKRKNNVYGIFNELSNDAVSTDKAPYQKKIQKL